MTMDITLVDDAGSSFSRSNISAVTARAVQITPPGTNPWTPASVNTSMFAPGLVIGPGEAKYVKALGGTSARVGLYFNSFAASDLTKWPTGSTDDANTKQALDECIALGIKPTLVMTMHSNSPTEDLGGNVPMDKLLALLLSPALYKGKIDLELTNEPDTGAGPIWTASALSAYYSHHYPNIKALDPSCRVVGAAFDGCSGVGTGTPDNPVFGQPGLSYVNAFMSTAANAVDAVAIHIYYQMRPEHRFLSTQIVRSGWPYKDFCITETGWNATRTQATSPNEAQWGCSGDRELQASRECRDQLMQSCIPRMRYCQTYRARDSQAGGWGVFDSVGGDEPVSLAFKDLFPVLRDSVARRLYRIGSGDILSDIIVVAADMPDGTLRLFAWRDRGPATLTLWANGNAFSVKALGRSGSTGTIAGAQAQVNIAVDIRPVMLWGAEFPEYRSA